MQEAAEVGVAPAATLLAVSMVCCPKEKRLKEALIHCTMATRNSRFTEENMDREVLKLLEMSTMACWAVSRQVPARYEMVCISFLAFACSTKVRQLATNKQ